LHLLLLGVFAALISTLSIRGRRRNSGSGGKELIT
jgi:hypothetical protein